MNDEQLRQLFAKQQIPQPSEAVQAAAIKAALEGFAEQNVLASQTPGGRMNSDSYTAGIDNNRQRQKPRYLLNSLAARFSGLLAVAGLHAAVVIALLIGLAPKPGEFLVENVKVQTMEDLDEQVVPPPPPPPDYVPPPPDFVPPPQFNVAADAPVPANAITTAPAQPRAVPVAETSLTPARPPKKGLSPPFYPSESKKLGEEGVVALALYLNDVGRVQEAHVETSSGFARLDAAAVEHAVKAWKFEPCSESGKPVACWYKIKFRFQLKNF